MTLNGFFAALRRASRGHEWTIRRVHFGYGEYFIIRTSDADSCPICVVAKHLTGVAYANTEYIKAGQSCGLSFDDIHVIKRAGDTITEYRQDVRDKLLEAVR